MRKNGLIKPSLALLNVCAEKEGVELENISLFVNSGEILSVVGMHPSYLHLLRNIVIGNVPVKTGNIEVGGKKVSADRLRRLTANVRESGQIFPDLTIAENICISGVSCLRLSKKREEEYAADLLHRYNLDIDMSADITSLSAMNRLLVQVLQNIASDKQIMVFYDCMTNLGPHEKKAFQDILRDMKENGKAILYITSMLSDALLVSDRVAVLKNGTISSVRQTGEASEAPREILHEISGWSILDAEDAGGVDAVRAIVTSRELMTSSSELGRSLEYLAEDMKKVLHADRILICMTDQAQNEVMDFVEFPYRNKIYNKKNDPLVCEVIEQEKTRIFSLEDQPYGQLFYRHTEMKMLVCVPIRRPGKTCSLMMIFHKVFSEMDEMYQFFLSAFAKEVAIALETSELLGKSTLLQESHHRIKNNLQMINSLIYLQRQAVKKNQMDPDEAFQAISRQVLSIAAIHDILSNDSEKESIINLATIIRELTRGYANSGIQIRLDLQNVSIPYNKATMLAIVVNEMLTNSVKYAFAGREEEEKEIRITLSNDGIHILLIIEDNGIGYNQEDKPKGGGIGTSLTRTIIASIKGTLTIESSNGTRNVVVVPVSRIYDAANSAV